MKLELGKAIQIVRQAKGLKLGDLAKAANVSIAFLSLIEAEKRQPSLDVLRRLAHALDVPPEALIVLAQPAEGKLECTNEDVIELTDAIQNLASAESALRAKLQR